MGLRQLHNASITGGITRSREIAAEKASASLPYLGNAWQNTRNLARAASESAVWTQQAVAEKMPDREGWERIGRLGLRIADHAIDHGTKPYTFGIPVYKYVKEELGKNKSPEQPLKDAKENRQVVDALEERIGYLEKKLVEIEQNSSNQKTEKRPKSRDWCPPELIDLI